jgi:hypothetical protein
MVKLEKNERINLEYIHKIGDGDVLEIKVPLIQLRTFMNSGIYMMGKKFFSYDARKNNCQDFLIALLKANKCLSPEAQNFIKQDVEKLFENMPLTQEIMKKLTDTGGIVDMISQGGKLNGWIAFTKVYYHNTAKPKGLSYSEMLKSPELKKEYEKFKKNQK